MNRYRHLITSLSIALLLFFNQSLAAPIQWQSLEPGLDYAQLYPLTLNHFAKLHAFRIDLSRYKLNLVFASDLLGKEQATAAVSTMGQRSNALIAINGGFFSANATPLGLRIQNGQVRNQFRPISWWGVFMIRDQKAQIIAKSQFKPSKRIKLAIQSGPRLLINGHIPRLAGGDQPRSAICIDKQGQIILVVTQHLSLSTTDLARLMRKNVQQGGLGCVNALNLDGGASSQLYAHINNFRLNVPNFNLVTDALIVLPR